MNSRIFEPKTLLAALIVAGCAVVAAPSSVDASRQWIVRDSPKLPEPSDPWVPDDPGPSSRTWSPTGTGQAPATVTTDVAPVRITESAWIMRLVRVFRLLNIGGWVR